MNCQNNFRNRKFKSKGSNFIKNNSYNILTNIDEDEQITEEIDDFKEENSNENLADKNSKNNEPISRKKSIDKLKNLFKIV